MARTTRRSFLRIAAGAATFANAAAARAEEWSRDWTAREEDEDAAETRVWITDDVRRLEEARALRWARATEQPGPVTIEIDPAVRYQEILGFGAAFTDCACFNFHQMTEAGRAELFHDLFHPSQMGLNVCRTSIGASDSGAKVYSYDDGPPDPELRRFSIDYDRAYILPILREARSVNRDLLFFSSPWSPPGWMKDNGSMLGGCMRHTYMPSYARYFRRFIESYSQEGVPIHAVTVQNEVDADQQGLMPACFWPQDYEVDFVTDHLGPEFERGGVKTEIWILDHNYNLWGRAVAELESPDMRRYTRSVAWHGYVGDPAWMSRVHDAIPGVKMHWTEGSPDYNDPEYLRCWTTWAQKFITVLRNHCESVTGWSFATDEMGRPNVGPYPIGGMITIDSKTRAVYHSGQYFAMGHFSRFIRRGAVRIQSEGGTATLQHCAFRNPDSSLVLVMSNAGAAQGCEIRMGARSVQLTVPENSVVTLRSAASQPTTGKERREGYVGNA